MKRITTIVCLLFVAALISRGQLIINHRSINITTLTESEIDLAKTTLHIAYGHTSHGSQIITGMDELIDFANGGGKGMSFPDDIFAFNNGGTDGALDLRDLPFNINGDTYIDLGQPDREIWATLTRNYLNLNHDVNVVMWSWCGEMGWASAEEIDTSYLELMNNLEADFPHVKFVYMTGHLDGTGTTDTHYLRAQQIRNYCKTNKKILFDFADIESYDPDTLVNYMEHYATDNCDYDSSGYSRNWAIRWQNKHTENVDWYYCEPAHSQALNGNQKAYAAWRMFAEIAKMITPSGVPTTNVVSDTVVGNGKTACFDALDSITVAGDGTSVEFRSGSVVDLIAGKRILLKPGFHAFEGSVFDASITTNSIYCSSSSGSSAYNPVDKSALLNSTTLKNNDGNQPYIKVYPNPNNGIFNLQLSGFKGKTDIRMLNLMGKTVYQTTINEDNTMEVGLPALPRGIYSVKANNGTTVQTIKMIIR
jgi:hypothetical protein